MGIPELSQRTLNMPSYPPREIETIAEKNKIDLTTCLRLHLGDTHYTKMPEPMAAAMIEAVQKGDTHYTKSIGLPRLREQIAETYYDKWHEVKVDPEQIVIDPGSTLGIAFTCQNILNKGDYAIVLTPAYAAYFGGIASAEANVLKFHTKIEQGFKSENPDISYSLEKMLKKSKIDANKVKLLIINNPNNPTGQYESESNLQKFRDFANKYNILILCDEAYLDLIFDPYNGKAKTILTTTDAENVSAMGTFSKNWAFTGGRVGWRTIPKKYMPHIKRWQDQTVLSLGSPNLLAAIAAFDTLPEWYENNLTLLKEHRDMVIGSTSESGIIIPKNLIARAGLYQILPLTNVYFKGRKKLEKADSRRLVKNTLLKKQVLLAHGLGFGVEPDEDFVRISLCLPEKELKEGLGRIVELLHEDYEIRN